MNETILTGAENVCPSPVIKILYLFEARIPCVRFQILLPLNSQNVRHNEHRFQILIQTTNRQLLVVLPAL